MSVFKPEENTMICMYGPPGWTTSDPPEPIPGEDPAAEPEEETFLGKIIAFFQKIIDFIRNLLLK